MRSGRLDVWQCTVPRRAGAAQARRGCSARRSRRARQHWHVCAANGRSLFSAAMRCCWRGCFAPDPVSHIPASPPPPPGPSVSCCARSARARRQLRLVAAGGGRGDSAVCGGAARASGCGSSLAGRCGERGSRRQDGWGGLRPRSLVCWRLPLWFLFVPHLHLGSSAALCANPQVTSSSFSTSDKSLNSETTISAAFSVVCDGKPVTVG